MGRIMAGRKGSLVGMDGKTVGNGIGKGRKEGRGKKRKEGKLIRDSKMGEIRREIKENKESKEGDEIETTAREDRRKREKGRMEMGRKRRGVYRSRNQGS